MQNTLAVLCVLLSAVLVLVPVLFLVLMFVMPRADWDRHPRAVLVLSLLMAALRVWYSPPGFFTVGSVLLAYGVAALAHASHRATLSAEDIALLGCILLRELYVVRILQDRRR